jgi:uncharacterized membrane protein YbjE (DUF340 family)
MGWHSQCHWLAPGFISRFREVIMGVAGATKLMAAAVVSVASGGAECVGGAGERARLSPSG